jgi:hypothetical protein
MENVARDHADEEEPDLEQEDRSGDGRHYEAEPLLRISDPIARRRHRDVRRVRRGWLPRQKKGSAQVVLQRIQDTVTFPGETLILGVEGGNAAFGRKFRWMRGSRIV